MNIGITCTSIGIILQKNLIAATSALQTKKLIIINKKPTTNHNSGFLCVSNGFSGQFSVRPSVSRVCQYIKGLLISSSSSVSVKTLITRHLSFLFFSISIIFRFFSASKDCQKYIYFQRLYPVLLKMRLIYHSKNYVFFCYYFFL